jgi:hypothetical protein
MTKYAHTLKKGKGWAEKSEGRGRTVEAVPTLMVEYFLLHENMMLVLYWVVVQYLTYLFYLISYVFLIIFILCIDMQVILKYYYIFNIAWLSL